MQTEMSQEEVNYMKRVEDYHKQWWTNRSPELKKDTRREEKGVYYLGLSIISILGGVAGLIYGLAGKGWIQRPYVLMGAVMVLFGLSIVIGGFGKVEE